MDEELRMAYCDIGILRGELDELRKIKPLKSEVIARNLYFEQYYELVYLIYKVKLFIELKKENASVVDA